MSLLKICQYLEEEGVRFSLIRHAPAYSAQKTAAAARIPGREVAKVVIVMMDGNLAMAVIPADHHVDLAQLGEATGAEEVGLASEWEFKDRFPDCELGAMPPFGNRYNLPVYVAAPLTQGEYIAFHAGNYSQLVRLKYADFSRMVQPRVLNIALHRV